jgi:hypothetical protein
VQRRNLREKHTLDEVKAQSVVILSLTTTSSLFVDPDHPRDEYYYYPALWEQEVF